MRNRQARQRGMTLLELMVAMAVGLLVVLAATAALVVARVGFATVDAASQLRDNSRFAADLVNRILVQSGFEDLSYAVSTRKLEDGTDANPQPHVTGFNDALVAVSSPLLTQGAGGVNGSDVLIVRYQAGETFAGSGVADGTMVDCQGRTVVAVPLNRDDRMASIFHVAINNGEPSLMCTTVNGTTVAAAEPVVQGVEDFQVLYGVDGVVVNTAPSGTIAAAVRADRYLRADQLVVGGNVNSVDTYANWRRVRSIRIGMVLRAAAGSTQLPDTLPLYPFGVAASSGGGRGSSLASAADSGTTFAPRSDGRLRQVVNFTVHLRNAQDLRNPAVKP